MKSTLSTDLRSGALVYHRQPRPGKIEIQATKPLGNQRDLALAYSPGVAAACEAIVDDPSEAAELTSRQNLVAVITNGTALTEPRRYAVVVVLQALNSPMRAPREVTMRERFMTSLLCRAVSGPNAPLTSRCPLMRQRTKFGTRCDRAAIGRRPE